MEERPRLIVALTFDHDAISGKVLKGDGPSAISRGEFGPRVGVPRLLDLLAREGLPSTWFVPGHTAVTFPDSVRAIAAAGHELACHGWAHEALGDLGPGDQRRIVERGRAAIGELWGRPPTGFRAPHLSLGDSTLELLERLGFVYDSSMMADDVHLYRVRHGDRHSAEEGSRLGPPGRLVEVPVSLQLDDWVLFEAGRTERGPMVPPAHAQEIWEAELRWAHEHEPGGVLTLTLHPEVIGRGSRLAALERFVKTAAALPGVAFRRLDAVVADWLAAAPPGGSDSQALPLDPR